MEIGRKCFFHAYWRTSAADISRDRQQLLHVEHFHLFIARNLRCFFQIHFHIAGNNADDVFRLVADKHERLKHLTDILAELVGNVCRAQIRFVDDVRD